MMTEKKLSEKMREVVGDPEKNIEFIVKNDGWVEQAKELEEKLAAADRKAERSERSYQDLRKRALTALQEYEAAITYDGRVPLEDMGRDAFDNLYAKLITGTDRPTAEPAEPPPSAVGLMVSHTKH